MRIKNVQFNTDLQHILDKLTIELHSRGIRLLEKTMPIKDYIMVTCPYHKNGQERKPSAQIREKDGLFYCFTCKETHSLPDMITHCLHENGWNWLLKNFSSVEISERHIELDFSRETPKQEFVDKSQLAKYRFTHPYMFKRKLTMNIIKKFDIGYDKETNCITFPVKDKKGNILFFARRSVATKFFSYTKGAEKPLYGIYEIYREMSHGKDIKEVYITESIINCLTLWTWGYYALALNGTGSYAQIEELKKLPFRTIILALDPDNAGRTGTAKIQKALKNHKFVKTVEIPEGKDVNDLTKEEFLKCKVSL